jgi:PTH1 family peptidyl-tRNA hydrolase
MNLSGDAVSKYVNFYKIDVSSVFVIQDDLDMPLERIKLVFNHGDGGHNGIKDIMLKLSSKEFLRLKIGIGKSDLMDTKDYVLGKFSSSDKSTIEKTFYNLRDIVNDYISMNYNSFIQKYNTKIHKE